MPDFTFEFQVRGVERLATASDRYVAAYQAAGRETMSKATALLHRAVVLRFQRPARGLPPAINTGLLRNSVTMRLPTVEAGAIEGGVATNVAYALPIELGARPHWPPRQPIEFWVRRKLRVPAPRVRLVAFFIARKIARRGTAPREIFALGLADAKPKMIELFQRMPQLILEQMRGAP